MNPRALRSSDVDLSTLCLGSARVPCNLQCSLPLFLHTFHFSAYVYSVLSAANKLSFQGLYFHVCKFNLVFNSSRFFHFVGRLSVSLFLLIYGLFCSPDWDKTQCVAQAGLELPWPSSWISAQIAGMTTGVTHHAQHTSLCLMVICCLLNFPTSCHFI